MNFFIGFGLGVASLGLVLFVQQETDPPQTCPSTRAAFEAGFGTGQERVNWGWEVNNGRRD